jgi:hypothetical protein
MDSEAKTQELFELLRPRLPDHVLRLVDGSFDPSATRRAHFPVIRIEVGGPYFDLFVWTSDDGDIDSLLGAPGGYEAQRRARSLGRSWQGEQVVIWFQFRVEKSRWSGDENERWVVRGTNVWNLGIFDEVVPVDAVLQAARQITEGAEGWLGHADPDDEPDLLRGIAIYEQNPLPVGPQALIPPPPLRGGHGL